MADPKPWEVEYEDHKPWEVQYEPPIEEQASLVGKSKEQLSDIARRLRVERNLGELEQGATDVATGFLSIPGAIGSKIFNIPTELPKSVERPLVDAEKIKQTLDPITEAWGMSGEPTAEAAKEVAAETTAGLTSPESLGIMATGPAAPAIFASEMAKGAPAAIQNLQEVSKTGDEKETAKAFMNAALSIGGPIAIARQAGLVKEQPAAEAAQPKELLQTSPEFATTPSWQRQLEEPTAKIAAQNLTSPQAITSAEKFVGEPSAEGVQPKPQELSLQQGSPTLIEGRQSYSVSPEQEQSIGELSSNLLTIGSKKNLSSDFAKQLESDLTGSAGKETAGRGVQVLTELIQKGVTPEQIANSFVGLTIDPKETTTTRLWSSLQKQLSKEKGKYASPNEKAAEIYGRLLSQSESDARQVPVKEGESRVQPETEGGLPKEEVGPHPTADQLVSMTPDEVVAWTKRNRYGMNFDPKAGTTSVEVAERLSPEDIPKLEAERDKLRADFKKEYNEALKSQDPERLGKTLPTQLKSQTLDEIIADYHEGAANQDYVQYQRLVRELKRAPVEERFKMSKEIEQIKNKYGGKPPPRDIPNPEVSGSKPEPSRTVNIPSGRGLQLKQPSPSMSQAGAINLGIAHDLFDAASDKVDLFSKIAAGHSAPKTSHASEASGNALVRYASANLAAPYLARSMTSEVLGNFRKDKSFRERLGAVLVEDRLRAIKKGLVDSLAKATDPKEQATLKQQIGRVNSLVGQGKFFADESAFRDAVSDPDIAAAIDRHKATVQKSAELYHQETGGQMAGPGLVTGAFVNLEALHEDIPGMVFGKGAQGDYSRPFKKKTVFGRKALGSAAKYELDYDRLAERMIRGNFEEYSKRQMYDQLQKDGLAVLLEPGMPRPDIGDKPAVKFQVERRGQPWGGTKVENLWVRSDIAPEVRQALNIEGPIKDASAAKIANVINKIQLAGPTDAIWHSANILNSIAGQQGGRTFLSDLARKVPGVNYADAMVRIGMRARDIMRDNPEITKELSDLAQIGATRPESLNARGPMSRMINLLDKAGRLVRNDLYNNLVERKIIEPSEATRREFVNKIGQYNPRLMGRFQRFFKEAGISPFIVAGRNFNRLAFQKATLNPGFKAATVGAAAQARALEAFGAMATLIAIPAFFNQLSVGNPNGRKGVPFGMIDTGQNNSKGDPIVVDPAQWTGLRRGMRLTGMNAVLNGIKAGKSAHQIESDAGRDIKGALIHPWAGPAAQAGSVLATGYTPTGFKESEDPDDYAQNVLGALKNLNPVVHSALKGNIGTSMGGAFGVKSVQQRGSFQEIKSRAEDWGLKNSDPKIKAHYEALAKSKFPPGEFSEVRTQLRTSDKSKIVESVNKILSLEPDAEKQNARMKQILKEFQPFVVNDDGTGHVKPFATDSKAHEKAFLNAQDEEGKALWRAALKERVEDYRKLTGALYGTPRNPPIPDAYRDLFRRMELQPQAQ